MWGSDGPELGSPDEVGAVGGVGGFSFSAGGFALAYHVGVVKVLVSTGLLMRETPLSGSSAGAVVAAMLKSGLGPSDLEALFFEIAHDLRSNGCNGRVLDVLRVQLEARLPHDAHTLCNDGTLFLGVSRLLLLQLQLVSRFESRGDLIDAVLASCFIPKMTGSSWTHTFRGNLVADGGLTGLLPASKSSLAHHVKVLCLPAARVRRLPLLNKAKSLANVAVAPDLFGDDAHQICAELPAYINAPGPDEFYRRLMAKGEADTRALY
ncbi:hypothetical protein FOA52_008124 [Chlamydomonas sp. UWO 241]|nr:hypothetical protein FOA52_008124 [Chlamydomonas sp. UWO 241]